jgi:RHS repeat-associated protein
MYGAYRYGFNGKENDNEVKGSGNQQDYGMRIYDPRLGRFLSVDPLTKEYPELTPFQFASNTPIQAIDLDGLEAKNLMDGTTILFPTQAKLKTLKSSDYTLWKDMLQFEKSKEYKNVFDKADKGRILDQQEMDWAFSNVLNTDYYAVNIIALPTGMDESGFFDHVRKNFAGYMDGQRFSHYDKSSKGLWNSSNPTGSLMVFKDIRDNADVLTTQSSQNHWVFTPVGTAWDWEHPLAGHREFGLTKNQDGTYTFYTRGVDMLWDIEDVVVAQGYFNFFRIADRLWNGVMDNIAASVNTTGGKAIKTHNFTRKIDWKEDVKEEDKGGFDE